MWWTPSSRATSAVPSVLPSSTIEDLDLVDAGDLAGEVLERGAEVVPFVQARNLDQELHPALKGCFYQSAAWSRYHADIAAAGR